MPPPSVVLVPGFGSSVLRPPGRAAPRGNSWLSLRRMASDVDDWIDANRTYYDHANRAYFSDRPLEVADFGGHSGVRDIVPDLEWIDWLDVGQGYYGGLIDGLDEVGARVLGAPYDFRTVLGEGFEGFRSDLRRLIEDNRPAVVVAHSMGAVLVRSILGDERFARRNVRAVVEVCPAHGGSLSSFEAMHEGSFYIPVPSAERRRRIASAARSLAGLVLTLPNRRAFDEGEPLWRGEDGWECRPGEWPWPEVQDSWRHLALPVLLSPADLPRSVPHVVLHSTRHDTPVSVDRRSGRVKSEGGDGVVTAASAICRTCDHTVVRHLDSIHRMSPADPATLAAVQKFLQ